jgi:hypothetical protein
MTVAGGVLVFGVDETEDGIVSRSSLRCRSREHGSGFSSS